MRSPGFKGLKPSSAIATRAARAASKKKNSKCEKLLKQILRRKGMRFSEGSKLTGKPDIVFPLYRVAIFCDGDFWHGRNLPERLKRLSNGHNSQYWVSKISTNVLRDRSVTRRLRRGGWTVLRYWESDILKRGDLIASRIERKLTRRMQRNQPSSKASFL
jgi:DNA mismatch endonuclease, patch repair protein